MKRSLFNLPVTFFVYITDIFIFAAGILCAVFVYMRIIHINPFPVLIILVVSTLHILLASVVWHLSALSQRIIRYSAFDDFLRLAIFSCLIYLSSVVLGLFLPRQFRFPLEIWFIALMVSFFLLISSRLLVGYIISRLKNALKQNKYKRLLIYGAGELGLSLLKTIQHTANNQYSVVGFLDADSRKIGRFIMGFPVYSSEDDIHTTIITNAVTHIIIADPDIIRERKATFLESIIMYNLKIRQLPSLDFWIDNNQNLLKLQQIDIADLLVRKPIELINEKTSHFIRHKIIMVTGAAGSIGSELVRALSEQGAGKIICVDFSESALFELEFEMKRRSKKIKYQYELVNIRDKEKMEMIIAKFHPEMIFHAAAYKHVPILETSPGEAIQTNVLATWQLAELAGKYGVNEFVMISTDKAVNPTSVMGVTKRLAEIAIQARSIMYPNTAFITTRFGNVLGSNGSVVPLFKKQISEGGPVTVTHPDMIRYFMTINEACQLVLEAAVMGEGGEIYVFDMGDPVKIYDLARNMIRLSGFIPEKDIKIEFTGLRPGEKLFEDLFSDKEKLIMTHHKKILIGRVREYDPVIVEGMINTLKGSVTETNTDKIKGLLKTFVPEYEYKSKAPIEPALSSEEEILPL